MAETTSKTQRQAGKVFDVARPGKQTPAATSRPVIVTNRPIIPDPMMAQASETLPTAPALSIPVSKLTINPLSDTEKKSDEEKKSPVDKPEAKEPAADKTDKSDKPDKIDVKELAASNKKQIVVPEFQEDSQPAAVSEEIVAEKPAETEKPDKSESKATTTEPASAKEKPAEDPKPPEDKPADTADQAKEQPAAEPSEELHGVPGEDGKLDAETAALEAEAKQQEAIDKLVESKQYFLPINAVERHRSKVAAVFGLLMIIILGLVLTDLLLDVGVIHISGVQPLTHFF